MNTQTVKLQIPMDISLRDGLESVAERLGFSSAQEYIRVWAKGQVDGRILSFGDDDWGQPSPAAAKRLNRWAEEAKRDIKEGKLKSYTTVEDFMKDLR
jgi:hypothetical protein